MKWRISFWEQVKSIYSLDTGFGLILRQLWLIRIINSKLSEWIIFLVNWKQNCSSCNMKSCTLPILANLSSFYKKLIWKACSTMNACKHVPLKDSKLKLEDKLRTILWAFLSTRMFNRVNSNLKRRKYRIENLVIISRVMRMLIRILMRVRYNFYVKIVIKTLVEMRSKAFQSLILTCKLIKLKTYCTLSISSLFLIGSRSIIFNWIKMIQPLSPNRVSILSSNITSSEHSCRLHNLFLI